MAQDYIIEININDVLDDVIRKCNANFRQISYAQRSKTRQGIRISDSKLTKYIDDGLDSLRDYVDGAIDTLQGAVDGLDYRVGVLEDAVSSIVGDLSGFVKKVGDTMTGDLIISKNDAKLEFDIKNIDSADPAPSSHEKHHFMEVYDRDGRVIGKFESNHYSTGAIGLSWSTLREINGVLYSNEITPLILDDGSYGWIVQGKDAFRTEIDAAKTSHNHAASNITSGTLALARGGTASDNTARAINTVFAGPSSGSAGNASWRSLVAADIPNLNANKITAGTLARERGGTAVNNSAISPNRVLAGPSSGTDTGNATFRALVAADIPNLNASKITAGTLGIDRIPTITAAKGGTGRTSARLSTSTIFSGKDVASGGSIGTNTAVFNYSFFLVTLAGGCYLFGYRTGGANTAGTIYAVGAKDSGSGARWIAAQVAVTAAGACTYTAGGEHTADNSATARHFTGLYGLY